MCLADAIAFTVILATGKAWISASSTDAAEIAREHLNPPIVYRHNSRGLASVILLWLGLVATIARYVVSASTSHGRQLLTLGQHDHHVHVLPPLRSVRVQVSWSKVERRR